MMKGVGRFVAQMKYPMEAIRLQIYYRRFPSKENVGLITESLSNDSLDLVTIAFNNPEMICYQYRLLKKFITDSFVYTVADNSTDAKSRSEIRAYCTKQGLPYIALPPSPYGQPYYSKSHGAALNYVYRNYIQPRSASFFGLLDHDIFPICPISPRFYLKDQPYYGMLQVCELPKISCGRMLYLWPGLAFFDSVYTQGKPLNFLPSFGGDTGSGSFFSLYKPLLCDEQKETVFHFADEERIPLWEGNDFQNDMYAYIGKDWLHFVNASDWRNAADYNKKSARMKEMLEDLLQK
ncbi:MAG: hypothetical protein PHR38_06970 [Bacteroidales bacterium]|nr:hypothetical protein [Bacteroidales bacterium]